MMDDKQIYSKYQNPLNQRYASTAMQEIFSDQKKFSTWRRLWLALAESEQELGLDISDEQLNEMREHLDDIDFARANEIEKELRHDVMAHIHAFGEICPKAMPIIHLGATSCYVGDNTDVLVQREALQRIRALLLQTMRAVATFAQTHKDERTLAYTHYQAAQPTTIGKRACLWLQDLHMDLEYLDFVLSQMKLLGCKGTTGTAASFLELFDGDHEKVKQLEMKIAEKMGLPEVYPVTGQTYTRKADYFVLAVLSGIAQSAHKFSNDIRLLSNLKVVDEPFETKQVGSSAMAYKRNPMRSERIASLCRLVMTLELNPAMTASAQWFERTLDDSANRRISIPQAFLAIDGVLTLYMNIISGMRVYPEVAKKHLMEELPFMATENILMYCVKQGKDRQEIHEAIREHSVAAAYRIKAEGGNNNLLDLILKDERFGLSKEELDKILHEGDFTGRAAEQTEEYLKIIEDVFKGNEKDLNQDLGLSVRV